MNQTPDLTTSQYSVTGMTCGGCARRVSRAIGDVPGVEDVQVDLAAGTVAVTGTAVDPDAVASAVGDAGYEVVR